MYSFTDTTGRPKNTQPLQTVFNGINLDAERYIRTLNVTGRGLMAPDLRLTNKPYGDGAWLDGAYFPTRQIEVEALVDAKAFEQYGIGARGYYQNLMQKLITREPKELKFTDDPNYHFNAIFSGCERLKEDRDQYKTTLFFTCADPYKYSALQTFTGTAVPASLVQTVIPDRIAIRMTETKDTLTITNPRTGQQIKLTEPKAKLIYTFEPASGKIWRAVIAAGPNTESALDQLTMDSDFEDFEILGGDKLAVFPSTSEVTVQYRERIL